MIRNKCLICKSNQFLTNLIKLKYSDKYIKKFLDEYYSVSSSRNILQKIRYLDYEIVKCEKCQFVWQKFIPNPKFLRNLLRHVLREMKQLCLSAVPDLKMLHLLCFFTVIRRPLLVA